MKSAGRSIIPMRLDPCGNSSRSGNGRFPSCTVIVSTRHRPERLRQCLESLTRLNYPRYSILVIENDGVSGEAEGIARRYGASYRLCRRRGLSAARNLGASLCTTDLLAFIDDDAMCDPDWLVEAAPLFQDESTYAVTGRIIFHRDHCSAPTHEFDPGNRLVGRESADWFEMTVFGGVGLGSNFVIRRAALQTLGGFDERLGRGTLLYGGEEALFLFRLIDAGYKVATCSQSVVRHPATDAAKPDSPLRSIAASTAVVTLLAFEHPRYIPRLVRYVWGAVRRRPQNWRTRPTQLFQGMASRWQLCLALLSGPFVYLLAAIRHLLAGTPCFAPSADLERLSEGLSTEATERAAPRARA